MKYHDGKLTKTKKPKVHRRRWGKSAGPARRVFIAIRIEGDARDTLAEVQVPRVRSEARRSAAHLGDVRSDKAAHRAQRTHAECVRQEVERTHTVYPARDSRAPHRLLR